MGKPWENHANPPGNPKFHGPGTGSVRPTSVGPGPSGGSLAAELPLPGGCRVSSRPSEAQASGTLGGKSLKHPTRSKKLETKIYENPSFLFKKNEKLCEKWNAFVKKQKKPGVKRTMKK